MSESALILAAVLCACGVLYALARAARRKKPITASSLRRELDKLTHDPRASASLIARERERSPHLSELEIVSTIVRRLRRERRR